MKINHDKIQNKLYECAFKMQNNFNVLFFKFMNADSQKRGDNY